MCRKGFIPSIMGVHTTDDVSAVWFLGDEAIERHPVLAQWTVGSPAEIPLDSMTTFGGLERTPDFQNVDVLPSFDRLYTARAALEYHWYRKSLGAVDYEKGIGWRC